MTIFLCTFKPKKAAEKNGTTILVTAVESVNALRAGNRADVLLEDHYADAIDNFFKVIVSEVPEGIEAPAVGSFDNTFHERYDFINDTWQPKPVISETNTDERDNGEKHSFATDLSLSEKIAAACLFGALSFKLDAEQRKEISNTLLDYESNPEIDSIVRALSGIEALKHAYPETIINLVDAINSKYSELDKFPQFSVVRKFAESWINTKPTEREEKFPAPAANSRKHAEIEMDIALALCDVDIATPATSGVNRAREMVKAKDDAAFKAFSTELLKIDGVTSFTRENIYRIVNELKQRSLLVVTNALERQHMIARLVNEDSEPASPVVDEPQIISNNGKFAITGLSAPHVEDQTIAANDNALSVNDAPSSEEDFIFDADSSLIGDSAATTVIDAPVRADFVSRADVIEKSISDESQAEQDNLKLWRKVFRTDERFTKSFSTNGGGTSINGTYMVMQATKALGPFGMNWGVDVLEERFDNGAPIMRPVKGPDGTFIKEVIPNGLGGYLTEVNHTTKIRLWYKLDGSKGEIIAYGCTPYISSSKNGVYSDGEAPKKSLTDATKKALSQLGFSADVFLGFYDDLQYREENKAEFAIKNASEKAEDVTRLREELDAKLTRVAETLKTAVTVNEAKKVHDALAREIETHRKSAESTGDKEHAGYLSGRLRRLSTLKNERIADLTKAEGESA